MQIYKPMIILAIALFVLLINFDNLFEGVKN